MSQFRSKDLISEAADAVSHASYSPRKLTLIHTGITAGAGLLVALLTYLLNAGIGNTGGLSGMTNRAMLETAQSVLQVLVMILSPFWAAGFVAAALRLSRRQEADPQILTRGLRRWGPVLRLLLLQCVVYFALAMVAVQIGSILYTFSSAAAQLEELVGSLSAAEEDVVTSLLENMDESVWWDLILGMLPYILIPMAVLMIPVWYRLRLAEYVLMDEPRCGALYAMVGSFRMTKGNCLTLLKIDLRYWWFYALEILVVLLNYGDVLLPLLGVPLNMGTVTASFLFYALALGAEILLYCWKKPQVMSTYALLYNRLLPQEQTQL